MNSIPEELLEQVERDNVVILVGEGINQGVLPSSAELVSELAKRCAYPPGEPKTLARVAGYYELTTRSRHGLIDLLRGQLDKPGLETSPSHRQIAQLHLRVVVTTCYDRLLEYAMQEAAIAYTSVVGNEEVAYGDEQKILLVWLWGVLDRPDSIVLTEDDQRRFLAGRENLSDVLRGELCRRTWLFLGFDPEDEWFRNYYDNVTHSLDRHRRRAYIVGTTSNGYARAWWAERAQILNVAIEPFLSELRNQLAARKQGAPARPQLAGQVTVSLTERPYKLLDYYETKDAAIFFGRERQAQQLTSLIYAHRLVLLYGASGVGKTSLLLAGTLPRLKGADLPYETIFVRMLEDPRLVIRSMVQRRLPEADLPKDGLLVEFLDAATRFMGRTLVIVLDQFEEFFIRFSPRSRAPFISELGALYDARDVPVKVVFSLREEWLASISEIEERIPEVYRTKMWLLPLSRDRASEAITAPVEHLGMRYEPALVNRLLDDLVDERMDELMGSKSATVMPPQLQLVCDALYERARTEGRQTIEMAHYEDVGRAQGILGRRIEEALREYPGEERELAKGVLMVLVTSQETKASADLKNITASTGAEQATVERVLSRLTGQRLVRRLGEDEVYELVHDILAATITGWIGEEDRLLKQARELIQRELVDWQQDPDVLLSQIKYQRINALREDLQLTEGERSFLLRAAILYGEDVPYWLEQVSEPDAKVHILLELLGRDAYQARLTAAEYLVGFPQDHVAVALAHTALEDSEPVIRDMAVVSLGRMGGSAGIKLLVKMTQVSDLLKRTRAVHALALIQDMAPDLLTEVTGSIRRQVHYELAKVRFLRNGPRIRRVTIAGAVGGAIGFGLGLTIALSWHHATVVRQALTITDVVGIGLILALTGLLAGAGLGFGITVGESLFGAGNKMARTLGGTLLGGVGFAALLPFILIEQKAGFGDVILRILGWGLFGMMTGLGITSPSMISSNRAVQHVGGVVGAVVGVLGCGALGFNPFRAGPADDVPTPVLLASGGLVGLIISFCIAWAETRWPGEEKEEQRDEADRVSSQ